MFLAVKQLRKRLASDIETTAKRCVGKDFTDLCTDWLAKQNQSEGTRQRQEDQKKDLGQIAMGADKNQTLKAIAEAEAYTGPSLIIAYAPCINHGLKQGMGCSQLEMKRAVDSGYWAMYRYNPQLKDAGKNPFILDSKEPTMDFKEFLMGEVRYSALKKQFPAQAEALFAKTEQDAKGEIASYMKLEEQ